jgi:iron(III) transport system substrate-binding protein
MRITAPQTITRRALLAGATTLAAISQTKAASPAPAAVTPELIAAARAEGKIAWYTADDLVLATKLVKAFEAKYGFSVQLERSGAERIFQRISQEWGSDIHACDVVTSSDVSYLLTWIKDSRLTPYIPAETKTWPAEAFGPNGFYVVDKFTLVVAGYNTRLVKPEDAPKSWADLLDPKWKGKMVKGHPGYSGALTTGTFVLSRLLGWEFFEKLAKQGVMQVQSATDPPNRVAQGERVVMADGAEITALRMIGAGAPLAIVYPTEGAPLVPVGSSVMAKAPHPNAAKLFMHFSCSTEGQQIIVDNGARVFDQTVTTPPYWTKLEKIKLLPSDPEILAREAEAVRKRYTQIFGV